jgi:uncharacterized surface protein with fasciclin (FAS1) repeats
MKKSFSKIRTLLFIGFTLGFVSCESEKWSEHYSVNTSVTSDKTIWETIKDNPQFSKFAWALKQTGYDKMLSESQMFTVWVPDNSAAASIDTTQTSVDKDQLLKEFVQNHISKYAYPVSGVMSHKVTLLNKKKVVFESDGSTIKLNEVQVKQSNLLASNGIIHVLDSRIPFFSNIWEYLSKTPGLDSIRSYFFANNRLYFDEAKSIPGDVNEEGQTVYLDSVIYNYNTLFFRLGAISEEDSSYTALLPTNTAWKTSYNSIKEYYRFFSNTPGTKIAADTLQRKYTLAALTQDLFYSKSMQKLTNDTLLSTSRNKFVNPFAGSVQEFPASNGYVYVTDAINYKSWESWHRPIKVEAERSSGRQYTWSFIYERRYQELEFEVSGGRYIEATPSISSVNPTITYEIPNTLSGKLNADKTIMSGGAYNIYCVFLPNKLKTQSPKPNKVVFSLIYQSENKGQIVTVNYNNDPMNYVIDAEKMTKVLVASNVVFPYSEIGMEIPNVKFRITSKVTANETATFSRDLLIDCIIFEPVR